MKSRTFTDYAFVLLVVIYGAIIGGVIYLSLFI